MIDEGEYRILLQDLHSELPDQDVKCLKFLAQPLIKKRNFENIKDGLAYFKALEDCSMLSSNYLDFLSELLETVGRLDLQARIEDESVVATDARKGTDPLVCPFRKLLFDIYKELPDEDLHRMRFLYGKVPKRATVEDPLDLFGVMIRDHSLTPESLDTLKKILSEISRQDLVEDIQLFEDTIKPEECGYPDLSSRISGPHLEEACLESTPYSTMTSQGSNWRQEAGNFVQDSNQQMAGLYFPPSSLESSLATSQSSYSDHMDVAIEDLKAAASDEIGMEATAAAVAEAAATGAIASFGDLNVCSKQMENSASNKNLGMVVEPLRNSASNEFYRMEADPARMGASNKYYGMAEEAVRNLAPDECYRMESEPRGWCLIIDVQRFKPPHLRERVGSDIDRAQLKSTFQNLKFLVKEMTDPNEAEITGALEAVSQADHSAYDCLVICILSHGGANYFYGHDGEKVYEDALFRFFGARACSSLAGKPKLFFFSYCRGLGEQEGVEIPETDSPVTPDLSDFLFGYATPQNYVSYRNRSKGTFYIEVLTRVLNEDSKRSELQHMLLRVNREVSEKETGSTNRQIPKPEHTLKRQLYFL